jgi:hypothetical protein
VPFTAGHGKHIIVKNTDLVSCIKKQLTSFRLKSRPMEEGFSDRSTFSSFTHVTPVVAATDFFSRTRSLEVSFGIYILR